MATNTISHVGDNLKKFRLERNLSVKSICNALQMPESTYRTYEINARTPSIEQLCEFADFFETSIEASFSLYCSKVFIALLLFMFIIIPLIPIFVGINNFVRVLETLLKKVVSFESTFKLLSSTIFPNPFT